MKGNQFSFRPVVFEIPLLYLKEGANQKAKYTGLELRGDRKYTLRKAVIFILEKQLTRIPKYPRKTLDFDHLDLLKQKAEREYGIAFHQLKQKLLGTMGNTEIFKTLVQQ